jgi:hypothetical protein
MPRVRFDGGVIGSLNTPSLTSAGGVWTLKDNEEYTRRGLWPLRSNPVGSLNATILVVAGGGGGGYHWGGGGGAGGVTYNFNFLINTGINYPVVIGAGGAGSATASLRGSNGSPSSISTIYTVGGGGGGSGDGLAVGGAVYPQSVTPFIGAAGGSGGGADSKGAAGGANTLGQGYAGGAGLSDNNSFDGAGGGGGAAAIGSTATGSVGGAGGSGAAYNFANGTSVFYAGGGGGGATSTGGAGGTGGGGAGGGNNNQSGASAVVNTGGGGGGGSKTLAGNTGGSGIVIVSYPLPQQFTGGTVTNNNGTNVVHTFTTSANLVALATPIDTYQPYNTLLVHADGTNGANNGVFIDSSTLNNTITKTGSTTQGTFSPFSTTGWSNYYPTTSDYTYFSDDTAGNFGTGDFTVECWLYGVNDPGTTSGYNLIFPNTTTNTWGLLTYNYQLIWHQQGAGTPTGGVVPLNRWTHLAAVRISSVTTIYVNGVNVGSAADTTNYSTTGTTLSIGPSNGGTGGFYLSNVRIVKGTGIYTANFTPTTTALTAIANTTFLSNQSNRFIDNSSSPNALTIVGAPKVQPFSPFNPTSAYSNTSVSGSILTGITSSDGLTIPYSTSTSRFTGDFTVECWFYMNNTTGTQTIFTQRTTSYVPFLVWVASGTLTLYMSSTNASWDIINGQTLGTIVPNQWYHYALVRSGSSIKSYLNGAVVGAGATSSATLDSSTLGLRIGCTSSATEYFNGYISNVRMVNGTAVYTSAFTPPTAPLTAITSTTFLLNATNGGIIDSAQKIDLSTYGNAVISTTQSKFGGGSIFLGGSANVSYVRAPSNPLLDLSTGAPNFTVECWFYTANNTAQVPIVSKDWSESITNPSYGIYLGGTATTLVYMIADGTTGSISNYYIYTGIAINTWYHVALVRNGSNMLSFLNGVLANTQTISITSKDAGKTFNIGTSDSTGSYFNGYIDEVRITKGIARYTSNFTPQTTAFLNT